MRSRCTRSVGGRVNIAVALGEIVRFLRLHRWIGLLAIGLSVWTQAGVAHAFTDPLHFAKPAKDGGGEGRWFTGSPADGHSCNVCHTGGVAETLIVQGLPPKGYVPNEEYEIRIAWPQTAARTNPLFDTAAEKDLPRAQLVAEFIAESAGESGTISVTEKEYLLQNLSDAELCRNRPNVKPRRLFGRELYRQPFGKPAEAADLCQATNLTRCLMVAKGCGASELRFKWTAPSSHQGTIWFSAGFVATDKASLWPEDDPASEITIPIAAARNGSYVSSLEQACSVSRVGTNAPLGLQLAACVIASLALVLRRFRARARQSGVRSC